MNKNSKKVKNLKLITTAAVALTVLPAALVIVGENSKKANAMLGRSVVRGASSAVSGVRRTPNGRLAMHHAKPVTGTPETNYSTIIVQGGSNNTSTQSPAARAATAFSRNDVNFVAQGANHIIDTTNSSSSSSKKPNIITRAGHRIVNFFGKLFGNNSGQSTTTNQTGNNSKQQTANDSSGDVTYADIRIIPKPPKSSSNNGPIHENVTQPKTDTQGTTTSNAIYQNVGQDTTDTSAIYSTVNKTKKNTTPTNKPKVQKPPATTRPDRSDLWDQDTDEPIAMSRKSLYKK